MTRCDKCDQSAKYETKELLEKDQVVYRLCGYHFIMFCSYMAKNGLDIIKQAIEEKEGN